MKVLFTILTFSLIMWACVSRTDTPEQTKGIGEITNVTLNEPLKPELVSEGKGIYEMKCTSCHRLDENRAVGPGFLYVTQRRQPEWIMNMVTNTEVMLKGDRTARRLARECMVIMPNQNLSMEEARAVLEFFYSNDGHAVGEGES